MDLVRLKQRAEKQVALKYDAWADLSGAQRISLVYQEMLVLLEEDEDDLLRSRLLVARDAWESHAWALGEAETFVQFLCDAGGRYRNEEGNPSGAAYDLSNYISIAWDVLIDQGHNPVTMAIQGWTKARAMLATMKKSISLIGETGEEVHRPEAATSIVVTDQTALTKVINMVTNKDVSSRDMMAQVQQRRVPLFKVDAHLLQDGSWSINARGLTQKQYALLQRLIERHAEIELT